MSSRIVTWLLALLPLQALGAGVESFSPQGEVKGARQVSARFDVEMVPLGDPRLPEPFVTDCAVKGSGRWVDGRNWVFDFERALPAGLRCRFSLAPGLKGLNGEALEPASFVFSTGGPAVLASYPDEGGQISEDQVFVLGLDAPVDESTLAGRFGCLAEGVAEKMPARLVSAADKARVLAAATDFLRDYAQWREDGLGRSALGLPAETPLDAAARDDLTRARQAAEKPGSSVLVARCGRRLPAGKPVHLLWEPGIAAPGGVATTVAQHWGFRVRPDFTAHLRCERLNPRRPCLPVLPMRLTFSAPVPVKSLAGLKMVSGKQVWRGTIDKDDQRSGYTRTVTFAGPFPESAALTLHLPRGLKDQDGRALLNAARFPLKLNTDEAPPLARFASDFGIYELNAEPALPLTVRYVEALSQRHAAFTAERLTTQNPVEIIEWLRRIRALSADTYGKYDKKKGYAPVAHFGAEDSIFEPRHKIESYALPKPLPDRDTEVMGIPLKRAGFHIVEVASPRLGAALMDKPRPYHVRAAALVTNLAVHFKRGDESSLVWVTRLDTGAPVAGAEVAVRDCGNRVHARGRTNAQGILRIAEALPEEESLPGCLSEYDKPFFVTASLPGDFSFVFSSWNDGISPWRFNLNQASWEGPYVAHAVLDRSLLRPGEEVAMKLFMRRKKSVGFGFVPADKLRSEVILRHIGSDEETPLKVKWDAQGIAEARYTLPREAKQGRYEVLIQHALRHRGDERLTAGEFRVADYRAPSVRARLSGPASAVAASAVQLDMQAEYLAGGAASHLPVTLRGQLSPWTPAFADYEDFSMANGRVRVGKRDAQADESASDAAVALPTRALALDAAGGARMGWDALPPADTPRVLRAEADYRDANGESRSAAVSVPLYPSAVLVGVQPDGWVQGKAAQRFRVLALNAAGKPQAGVPVRGRLYQQTWYSYRKRVIGGYYAFEHGQDTQPLDAACEAVTNAQGLAYCETQSPATGQLLFEVEARDAEQRPSYAHHAVWVPEGDGWIDASDNDRMDLIPEQRHYEIGETARLRLRMPFPAARVLVSVEREGVLDAWVTEVRRDNPVIEVPMKPEYGPNVFVSALAVRGRVGGVQPTAMLDLGKPAFRMGVTELRAGWSGYALKVALEVDKPADKPGDRAVYQPRDKVKVKVRVRRPDGGLPGKNAEVALAAVDEALLELAPNPSWKLLDAMMTRRGIAVTTSTAQMQVVGKRHFGRKAVAAGGGGGAGATARELFDTRVFWQARIRLDENGEANVEVPLNDSLTRFRIVAVANVNVGRFGSGETSVAVSRDLQLFSGAAPVVREGDRLKAYFTVRNASARAMEVLLAPRMNGQALPERRERLQAGEGREIGLPLEAPHDATRIEWELAAREIDANPSDANPGRGHAQDRLKVRQRVIPAVPVRTFQATLAQLGEAHTLPVRRPADAVPGRGGVGVKFQASLGGDLSGVREYMAAYPWSCLEQQISKAIALDDAAAWRGIAAALPAYLDSDGLAKYWPELPEGSDVLTAYLLSVTAEAGLEIPQATRARLRDGLIAFVEGRVTRDGALRTADLAVRKLAALEALARDAEISSRSPGAPLTLNPAWLESFQITPNLWPTSAVLDWANLLARAPGLPERDARLKEARGILRARLQFAGTVMGFANERRDAWWWLMTSGDSNANRMLLSALDDADWQAADLGRLMRGALARQDKGHWDTTVANAWGALAARRFSHKLESAPVTGVSAARLGEHGARRDWSAPPPAHAENLLPWPADEAAPSSRSPGSPKNDLAPPGGGSGVASRGATLKIEHQGGGRPWVTVSSRAAIPLKAPLDAGYRIRRVVTPVSQKQPGAWHRGDVMRVRLEVEARADMGWVALLDPIPAGSAILGTGLGGDAALLDAAGRAQDDGRSARPSYEERTQDSFRAYYRYLPQGRFSVEYTLRLNNEGRFNLPPARVEAMYAPEMFGETPVADVVVEP